MLCPIRVGARFWICRKCAKAYDLDKPFADWPAWAKQLKADHQAARRSERERLAVGELTFSDSPRTEQLACGGINLDPRHGSGDEWMDGARAGGHERRGASWG